MPLLAFRKCKMTTAARKREPEIRPTDHHNASRCIRAIFRAAASFSAIRLLYGHVIDFLLFDLHIPFAHPWPAFNVADSCITIRGGLFHHSLVLPKERGSAAAVAKERAISAFSRCHHRENEAGGM